MVGLSVAKVGARLGMASAWVIAAVLGGGAGCGGSSDGSDSGSEGSEATSEGSESTTEDSGSTSGSTSEDGSTSGDEGDDTGTTESESDAETGETDDGTESESDTESDTTDTDTDTETGGEAECGNGVVEDGEECDDGVANDDTAACTTACLDAACGDGFVHAGVEACDDGVNDGAYGGCNGDCLSLAPHCGDAVLNGTEECDDGNTDDNDACTAACATATCGDGIVYWGVEPCDDGNTEDTDACLTGCIAATCGDSIVWVGQEICDDGNTDNTDGCNNACSEPGALQWERTNGGNHSDAVHDVATDSQGNVLVAAGYGYQSGVADWWDYIWAKKFDASGGSAWTETHNPEDGSHAARAITADPSDNVIVAGTVWKSPGQSNLWIRKLTPDGDEVWTIEELGPYPTGVVADSAGNILVGGWGFVGSQEDNDIWLRKYDGGGNEVWERIIDGPNADADRGTSLAIDGNDNVVIAGYVDVAGQGYEPWLRKYDASGTEQWTEIIAGTTENDQVTAVTIDGAGNVIVAITTDTSEWLRKYDAGGNEQWTLVDVDPEIEDIAADADGNIFMTSDIWIGFGEENDVFLRKYDAAGVEQWTESWGGDDGLSDRGVAVATDALGFAVVAGIEETDNASTNIWVGKFAP